MQIKAFDALRFNKDVVTDAGACISPPYDVIDDVKQEKLYEQNEYNIVRAIRGKEFAEDNETNNKYTRANDYLQKCIEDGALAKDSKPAIYAYVQNFDIAGEPFQRSGFIALGEVTEFGAKVKPHEKTLEGPKADRLKLMMATKAQFGQIFMLYDDPQKVADGIIDKNITDNPLVDSTDEDNVRHRLFAIDDPAEISAVEMMMDDKDALIADGHHRYETALNYYKMTQDPNARFHMMTFVNMHNEGLVILPTHRLVGNLERFDAGELLGKLEENFLIQKYQLDQKAEMFAEMNRKFQAGRNSFGLYAKDDAFYCLTLKNKSVMDELAASLSDVSKSLDVSVLHTVILDNVLGIGDEQLAEESNIEYIKDIGDAIDRSIASVDSGEMQAVFFMNPTKIEQVQEIAKQGEKMPQKSTFFHPKIFTGLTVNKL